MNKYFEYIENVQSIIEKIKTEGADSVLKTAEVFKNALKNGKNIFLFGTGHSHMLAEELFYRAGGLVQIRPVLCEPLMLHESASESTLCGSHRPPCVFEGAGAGLSPAAGYHQG